MAVKSKITIKYLEQILTTLSFFVSLIVYKLLYRPRTVLIESELMTIMRPTSIRVSRPEILAGQKIKIINFPNYCIKRKFTGSHLNVFLQKKLQLYYRLPRTQASGFPFGHDDDRET